MSHARRWPGLAVAALLLGGGCGDRTPTVPQFDQATSGGYGSVRAGGSRPGTTVTTIPTTTAKNAT